jgi:hypothetical protein
MEVEGVREARVDWQQGKVWIRFDPTKTTPGKLVDAVNAHTSFRAYLLR